jgi:hypothetical protein
MVCRVGTLGHLGLADQDQTGLGQSPGDGAILLRHKLSMDGHARLGGNALRPAQVLEGQRQAIQRPQGPAPGPPDIAGPCLCHRQFGRQGGISMPAGLQALRSRKKNLG